MVDFLDNTEDIALFEGLPEEELVEPGSDDIPLDDFE